MDTLGSRCSFLLICRMPLGSLLGPHWRHFSNFLLIWSVKMGEGFQIHFFCDCSVFLDARMGDWFQVPVFSDAGMEMMLECDGCMCLNHSKKLWF